MAEENTDKDYARKRLTEELLRQRERDLKTQATELKEKYENKIQKIKTRTGKKNIFKRQSTEPTAREMIEISSVPKVKVVRRKYKKLFYKLEKKVKPFLKSAGEKLDTAFDKLLLARKYHGIGKKTSTNEIRALKLKLQIAKIQQRSLPASRYKYSRQGSSFPGRRLSPSPQTPWGIVEQQVMFNARLPETGGFTSEGSAAAFGVGVEAGNFANWQDKIHVKNIGREASMHANAINFFPAARINAEANAISKMIDIFPALEVESQVRRHSNPNISIGISKDIDDQVLGFALSFGNKKVKRRK
jgi:hypothetical protein